jgi:hypothetical protein
MPDGTDFLSTDPEYARFLLSSEVDESINIDSNILDPENQIYLKFDLAIRARNDAD